MGLKIGVVGFSRNQFNKKEADSKLRHILAQVVSGYDPAKVELVSGYTASGGARTHKQIESLEEFVPSGLSASARFLNRFFWFGTKF